MILLEERIETLKKLPQQTKETVELYRFQVSLVINCVDKPFRRFHYTEVGISEQYEASQIQSLRQMHKRLLVSSAVNVSPFLNLEELNLSHNLLTDIMLLGLEHLHHLRVLDVSFNNLQNPLPQVRFQFHFFSVKLKRSFKVG